MRRLKIRWPHFHSDPDWKIVNVHALYQCQCGARRTKVAYKNLMGPIQNGWPDTYDRHGVEQWDSGWVMPPAEGWPEPRASVPPPPPGWAGLPPDDV